MCISLHAKYSLFLSDLNETSFFSMELRKTLKHNMSRKSVHWESFCSLWTDGQTGMTKLIVAFRNFAKVPNKNTKINALRGIQTRNLSNQVASDLRINTVHALCQQAGPR